MKKLSIAGVVASSKETTIGDVNYLSLSVAINDKSKTFVKVMQKAINNFSIAIGSIIVADGDFDIQSNHDAKSGKTYTNVTLWAQNLQVLNKPKTQDDESKAQTEVVETPVQAEEVIESKEDVKVEDKSEASALELALAKIDSAKSEKQCGFIYMNFVKNLNEEDHAVAQKAINAKKQALKQVA